MITIALILASIFAYHLITAVECRKILLTAISMWVYYTFVEWYVLLIPVIAGITYCALRVAIQTNRLIFTCATQGMLLGTGLLFLKYGAKDLTFPVGYSIMAFSSISAVYDGYRNSQKFSFWSLLTYISFFPKILAGPLERINAITAQYISSFSCQVLYVGIKHLVFGLFGKYIISANIETYLKFDNGCIEAIASAISYAIMFYIDFWSYCNIAIGFAAFYGIRLSQNFLTPYKATSFRDFWKRWNITLTSWLKDYVYIPLGGSKHGVNRQIFTVFVVFVISALWHGISIPFIIWGLVHASLYSIEYFTQVAAWKNSFCYRIYVFVSVCLLWQMFRFNGIADIALFMRQLTEWRCVHSSVVIMCVCSLSLLFLLDNDKFQNIILGYPRSKSGIVIEVVSLSVMAMCLILTGNYSASPFIYFSF